MDQNQQQSETEELPSEVENPPLELPKNEEPKAGPPNDMMLRIYQTTAEEERKKRLDLEARLTQLQSQNGENAKPRIDEQKNKEFWENPDGRLTKLETMLKDSIAPLHEFRQGYEREQKYTKLRARFANDPRFKEVFEKAGHLIDETMSNSSEMSEQVMLTAILTTRGAAEFEMIPGVKFGNSSAPAERTTPPHLRSSSPPAPKIESRSDAEPLTEAEKSEARRSNLSENEYRELRDLPPEKLMDWVPEKDRVKK